jgi:hypothetical protein
MFANKYMALSVKYTALLARPLVLREKLCFCEFRSVKYNTSNLGRIVIFFPELFNKKCVSNSKQDGKSLFFVLFLHKTLSYGKGFLTLLFDGNLTDTFWVCV